ncbi:uncharacterized protein LOC131436457 [Malaya genurostris]|uniref:uncharacterized protein LOC131436457 n=1 Tax=Malaya genurostris TaxID=325434 RepID=UPI0026F3E6C0|nr:uncharacterized protein LOC131436457 [Malaya genurostris]XP_058461168.1 uncharacterized protein LOC131436457 [Malaya genurostris]
MNIGHKANWPLEPFNDSVNGQDLRREWEEWHRSFKLLLELRKIENQHDKLVLLLSLGGRGLQRIYYNLGPVCDEIYPEAVKVPLMPTEEPEYDNAIKRLQNFFVGKRNDRVELELFRSLKQSSDESFNNFVLRLRIQASRCAFTNREEMEILHQITMGAKDERVRDKGLENVFSLDELTNYAVNREILMKQKEKLKSFSEELVPAGIATIQSRRLPRSKFANFQGSYTANRGFRENFQRRSVDSDCGRCGSNRHKSDSHICPAQNARCNKCFRTGHFARKCNSGKNFKSRQHQQRYPNPGETNSLEGSIEWNETLPTRPKLNETAKVDD